MKNNEEKLKTAVPESLTKLKKVFAMRKRQFTELRQYERKRCTRRNCSSCQGETGECESNGIRCGGRRSYNRAGGNCESECNSKKLDSRIFDRNRNESFDRVCSAEHKEAISGSMTQNGTAVGRTSGGGGGGADRDVGGGKGEVQVALREATGGKVCCCNS